MGEMNGVQKSIGAVRGMEAKRVGFELSAMAHFFKSVSDLKAFPS